MCNIASICTVLPIWLILKMLNRDKTSLIQAQNCENFTVKFRRIIAQQLAKTGENENQTVQTLAWFVYVSIVNVSANDVWQSHGLFAGGFGTQFDYRRQRLHCSFSRSLETRCWLLEHVCCCDLWKLLESSVKCLSCLSFWWQMESALNDRMSDFTASALWLVNFACSHDVRC